MLESTVWVKKASTFDPIVYNRAIVYKRQNFVKVVVHVIIIGQCNHIAR